METDHQEHTVNGLQEYITYTFTVNQSGFSGGRVFSTSPVYARTFTAGNYRYDDKVRNYIVTVILYLHSSLRSSTVTGGSMVCTTP